MRFNKSSICLGLQLFTWIGCLGWFLVNSYETLNGYFEKQTFETTVEKTTKDDEEVFIPDVVICSKNKFRNNQKETRTIDEYQKNTFDPSHFIQGLKLFPKNESMTIAIKDLFTYTFGWCKHLHIEVC